MIRNFRGFVFANMVRPALLAAFGFGLALSGCVTAENSLSEVIAMNKSDSGKAGVATGFVLQTTGTDLTVLIEG